MPAYFRVIVGSIHSAKALKLSIKESGAKNVVVIGDKGFFSESNVVALEEDGLKYVLPLKRNVGLINYDVLRSGDKSRFVGFFRFEKRVIWFYDYVVGGGRRVVVFLDERLRVEEERGDCPTTNKTTL